MYPTTVVGFVDRDGALPTINGVVGRQNLAPICDIGGNSDIAIHGRRLVLIRL